MTSPNRPLSTAAFRWTRPLFGFTALVAIGSSCARLNAPDIASSPELSSPAPATIQSKAVREPAPNFVVQVVNSVGPAVVRIDSTRRVQNENGSPVEDMFGFPAPGAPRERVARGTGSGFIFEAKGLILTNAHVVDQADTVTVLLKDGRQLKGKVLGEDTLTDVAVVQVDAVGLPTARLGESEEIQPGEWAIAIGNPLGLDNTVTMGIISATGRSGSDIGISDRRVRYIQTDAAINPGNSGGPLLNARGQVIGVNTAIIQGAQGLGFAIPIDSAQLIARQLVKTGKVEHAYLGVQMADITPELRERLQQTEKLKVPAETGVMIVQVVPKSPADRAGLVAGDLIKSINQQPILKTAEVQQAVEALRPGAAVALQIKRDQKVRDLRITLGTLPAELLKRDP